MNSKLLWISLNFSELLPDQFILVYKASLLNQNNSVKLKWSNNLLISNNLILISIKFQIFKNKNKLQIKDSLDPMIKFFRMMKKILNYVQSQTKKENCNDFSFTTWFKNYTKLFFNNLYFIFIKLITKILICLIININK